MARDAQESPLLLVFAENIRRLRGDRGFSQEELAERARVHRTFVGMIERRERSPTIHVIEQLAQALDVEPGLLLMEGCRPPRLKR